MVKTPFKSKNFWANIVNIVLVFLMGAKVAVPQETASDLLDAIFAFNPVYILAILGANILLPLYKTIMNKSGDWKASLFSTNLWAQVLTAVLFVATFYGAVIPEGTALDLADTFVNGNWSKFIGILFVNVLLPILHVFIKPKLSVNQRRVTAA